MKVYHFTGPEPLFTNSFLLVSDKNNAVIIDPACSAAEYKAALQKTGASLKLMLCTHGHMDHMGAAEQLRAEYGAQLRCGVQDVQGNSLFPLTQVDGGYADEEVITLDELSFRVITTPGHSQGSVCILCGDHFFTGDTMFYGDTGRTDLPGGDPDEMVRTARKLRSLKLPADTKVLPGHDIFSTYGREMAENWCINQMCPAEEV